MDEQPAETEEWMLQGVQTDYSRCSYEQYGVCRQQVFVCRTCRDQYDRLLKLLHPDWSEATIQHQYDVGFLCEQCAHFCHTLRGHDVVALGVKNNITCDCGNTLFRRLDWLSQSDQPDQPDLQVLSDLPEDVIPQLHACSLYPGKEATNVHNKYTHNVREKYCYCDGEESLPMVQCVRCCDWFHNDCAMQRYAITHNGQTIDLNDESIDFICEACEGCKEEVIQSRPVVQKEEKVEEEEGLEEEEEEERLERLIRVCKRS